MRNIILYEVSRFLIPFIQILGVHIIFHGHLSPGGGFAGGTIIGASLILYRIIYGKEVTDKRYNNRVFLLCVCISLIIYGALKGYSFITGGMHIDIIEIPLGTPGNIISGGLILPLNICVGIIVSVTIYMFFKLFYEGEF